MINEYTTAQLDELLINFRNNNDKYNITGLLMYCDKNIIQYIEGENQNIIKLYDNICKDTRHTGIIKLFTKEIHSRRFTNWKMGYKNISIQEYINFIETATAETYDKTIISLFNSFINVTVRY